MKFLPFLFFAATALVACKKDNDAPTIDFGPNGGITVRDTFNYPQGTTDPTDWTLDGIWNQQEQDLFKGLGLDLNVAASGTMSLLSAYPNPVASQVVFEYETPVAVTCSFVIVDDKYRVVKPLKTSIVQTNTGFHFDMSQDFPPGKRYRLYYVFQNGPTLYYKGHGDIKVGM
ncbi:hypothetical protein [Hymenobacter canadensis]|uniref:Uncharacterized protein n=1 Tax=Hymenobacter canadensis TaxID=2999067 RepID=A0ABY7LJ92_9BACT|nr:hypothetical protein [Hymenobacter canadensis]WBA40518.1 hypothetical protein O3303_11830 [Hymenobacter canadensis]